MNVFFISDLHFGHKNIIRPEKYKRYEAKNGWGTVEGIKRFFRQIIDDWNDYILWRDPSVVAVTTFWIL